MGKIITEVEFQENTDVTYFEQVGEMGGKHEIKNKYLYNLQHHSELHYVDPFLENFDNKQKEISFTFKDNEATKLEVNQIIRDIYISPWGIIRIKEDFIIQNLGITNIERISLNLLPYSKSIRVYDEIGAGRMFCFIL